jgi:hypothetical protein
MAVALGLEVLLLARLVSQSWLQLALAGQSPQASLGCLAILAAQEMLPVQFHF